MVNAWLKFSITWQDLVHIWIFVFETYFTIFNLLLLLFLVQLLKCLQLSLSSGNPFLFCFNVIIFKSFIAAAICRFFGSILGYRFLHTHLQMLVHIIFLVTVTADTLAANLLLSSSSESSVQTIFTKTLGRSCPDLLPISVCRRSSNPKWNTFRFDLFFFLI